MTYMIELVDKDIKAVIKIVFHTLKKLEELSTGGSRL
jgi:hypothetical protein